MQLTGIHHLTAISARPCGNLAFQGCSGCGQSRTRQTFLDFPTPYAVPRSRQG